MTILRKVPKVIMETRKKIQFAVLGSASVNQSHETKIMAQRAGKEIARIGGILLTGGCTGLPHIAASAAKEAGGLTMYFSPGIDYEEHTMRYAYPGDGDLWVFTGMGRKGRNVILVRSAHACVFIGGGLGTLNEFTIACDELGADRSIGIIEGSGGTSDIMESALSIANRNPRATVFKNWSAEKLIEDMSKFCAQPINKPTI